VLSAPFRHFKWTGALRTVGLLVGRIPLLGVELQTVRARVYIPLYMHDVGGLQRDVVY
jgi:hypothetical protein